MERKLEKSGRVILEKDKEIARLKVLLAESSNKKE